MKEKLPLVARLILGIIFLVFGLNGFFNFIPVPPMPDKAAAFMGGLMGSGYFLPFLKTIEVTCGLLLLSGCFVPLALVSLAPIVIHIFLFHAFLAPSGLPLAIVIGSLVIYLAFFSAPYSPTIKPLFGCRQGKEKT